MLPKRAIPAGSRLYSYIGSRPILLEKDVGVAFKWSKEMDEFRNEKTHKTQLLANLHVSGPQGSISFPFHRGLLAKLADAHDGLKWLHIVRDDVFLARANKLQKKFITAMWGTTAAHVRQFIQGVTEVLPSMGP